jgi:hypothetical protein
VGIGTARSLRTVAAMAVALSVTLSFAACASSQTQEPTSAPTMAPTLAPTTEPTVTVAPSPTPAEDDAPVLYPHGSAQENLPYFELIVQTVWESMNKDSGRAYINALVHAGFDKAHMQVTADRTTVGNKAETLFFSVAWGAKECLIGQVGPSTGKQPVVAVMSQLAHGRCLIGNTVDINW